MSRKISTNSKVQFGKRLKKLRLVKGLKQKEFANSIGITVSYLSQIENGEKGMSLDTLSLLSVKFGVNIDWLITGEGPMFREEERNLQERIQELEAELKKMEETEEEGEDTRVPGEGLLARLQAKIRQLEAENRYLKGMVAAYKDALKHLNKAPNSG